MIEQIANDDNELWFSVASVWEMGIKVAIGKLLLPEPVGEYVSTRMTQLGARSLDITAAHAVQASMLPLHHRDPFDRMLIAQAQLENMRLVSADSMLQRYLQRYDVALLWAAATG